MNDYDDDDDDDYSDETCEKDTKEVEYEIDSILLEVPERGLCLVKWLLFSVNY
jgi:hypothetical protein